MLVSPWRACAMRVPILGFMCACVLCESVCLHSVTEQRNKDQVQRTALHVTLAEHARQWLLKEEIRLVNIASYILMYVKHTHN
jgi:hypothetical protein